MASFSNKVRERLVSGIKRFQPILSSAKARDVNESDTVTIVNDLLAYVLGYDKYSEITSEFVIRGTYVDLAIKLEGQLHLRSISRQHNYVSSVHGCLRKP